MTALIDTDSLLYTCAFALEDKIVWNELEALAGLEEPDEPIYYYDAEAAKLTIDNMISNIMFAVDATDCMLCVGGEGNFRNNNPLGYKQHRKALRIPELVAILKDYVVTKYNAMVCDGMEADDVVTYYKNTYTDKYTLCAIDKDVLYQTPGTHYNYKKDIYVNVKSGQAVKYKYYQCLVGDTTDGYTGCKGIGDVKARKILDDIKPSGKRKQYELQLWQAVVDTYIKQGMTEQDAIYTMQLCDMHQFNGKEIVLWSPSSLLV